MKKTPRILVVNDDGWHGSGLQPLISALSRLGRVCAVVPERERSAESHCLTLHKPLRAREVREGLFVVNGSPADCARLGACELMKGRVDVLVSGINQGYNLGEDVVYSGTVAGALEGAMLGLPSLAVSRGLSDTGRRRGRGAWSLEDFTGAAVWAGRICAMFLRRRLPPGVCLNVNVPPAAPGDIRGALSTRLGSRLYAKKVTVHRDPRGVPYYWLASRVVSRRARPGTDVAAVREGLVSITPLHADNTHEGALRSLRRWKP